MSYHYIREPGEEGSILTVESDQAAGVDLATLIERERPPLRAGLEIASALADILTIAEEDGAFHGDVKPGEVFIDATGSVSLAGYGVPRRTTRAPESHPQGMQTDVFGLGVVLHSLLSDHPLGRLPQDPDGHDEEIIQRVWAMDFSEVEGRRWLDDVRTFLCKILAFYPDDRPAPLDAANVLAQVASQCPGRPLSAWASRAVPAAGGQGAERRPLGPISEDLGGPQALSTPMPQGIGGYSPQRTAPSSKGESTAFWSKDRIAAMMAEEDDDDESDELPPPVDRTRQARQLDQDGRARPGAAPREDLGGPSAASFGGSLPPAQPSWGQSAPAAPPSPPSWGGHAAPPPPVPPLAELPDQDSPSEAFFKAGDAMQDPEPPPAWQPHSRQPMGPPPPVTPKGPPPGPIAISGPTPDQVAAAEPDIPRPPTGSGKGKLIAAVVVVMLLGCMGVASLGGGYWYFTMGPGASDVEETPAEVDDPPDVEVDPPEPRDTDVPKTEPPKEEPPKEEPPKEEPKPATPTKTTSTSTTGSKSSGTKTTPPPPPRETTPPPVETTTLASGQSDVRINFADNAEKVSLTCGDGQKRSFSGSTAMSFTGTVTCRVKQGKNMGVFTVTKSGTVSCGEDSRGINCSGP